MGNRNAELEGDMQVVRACLRERLRQAIAKGTDVEFHRDGISFAIGLGEISQAVKLDEDGEKNVERCKRVMRLLTQSKANSVFRGNVRDGIRFTRAAILQAQAELSA